MKISARNVLRGTVTEVKLGAVAAQVRLDIGGGNTITAMVTADAVSELGIREGSEVSAVIKATEGMLAT